MVTCVMFCFLFFHPETIQSCPQLQLHHPYFLLAITRLRWIPIFLHLIATVLCWTTKTILLLCFMIFPSRNNWKLFTPLQPSWFLPPSNVRRHDKAQLDSFLHHLLIAVLSRTKTLGTFVYCLLFYSSELFWYDTRQIKSCVQVTLYLPPRTKVNIDPPIHQIPPWACGSYFFIQSI